MKILARYVHGSADSTDCDVIYIAEQAPDHLTAKAFCSEDAGENRNIAVVQNGTIQWCYKGFPDEVNNSLLATYPLHPQEDALLVTKPAVRDIPLKLLSVLRKNLMELRHTSLRNEARRALKSGYAERFGLLERTDLRSLSWNIPEEEQRERIKSMAFQLGQALSLYEGAELYTKGELADFFPSLKPYLYRQSYPADHLEAVKEKFLQTISSVGFTDCGEMTVSLAEPRGRLISLKGKEHEVYGK